MTSAAQRQLARRRAADRRLHLAGAVAVLLAGGFVLFLLATLLVQGVGGFRTTTIALPIELPAGRVSDADFETLVDRAAVRAYGSHARELIAPGAWTSVPEAVRRDPTILGQRVTLHVPASAAVDLAYDGHGKAESKAMLRPLRARGALGSAFDWHFFTAADATDPVDAGIWGALKGSLLTIAVTLAIALPVGVLAAFYLEEFSPRSRWSDLIEVSINNLAAVPSIIFGLLGLAVFIGMLDLPRSAPIVGGLTLALMTTPVVVIASRAAIRGVPPTIREAALSVGASPMQLVFDHVLPPALPGILTGAILGVARALGETAPLLLIGMRAFIAGAPDGVHDAATVLPAQIFLWSDNVSRGFVEKTSAAILVLLAILLLLNGAAVWLRHRVDQRS